MVLLEARAEDEGEAAADDDPVAAGGETSGDDGVLAELAGERLGEHRRLVVAEPPVRAPAERGEREREADERFDLSLAQDGGRDPELVRLGDPLRPADAVAAGLDRREIRDDEERR